MIVIVDSGSRSQPPSVSAGTTIVRSRTRALHAKRRGRP
jgi:hypothetical protein